MRIRVLSDLHLEFEDFSPSDVEADVVVLAGDIHTGIKGISWAASKFTETPVVYVAGNHEYYGNAFPTLTQKMRAEAEGTTVHVLERDALTIDGVRFLGCTFWTDFRLLGDARIAGYEASRVMTDYRKIRVSPQYRKLRSLDTAMDNHRSTRWLREQSKMVSAGPVVIVTHHAPSRRSLPAACLEDLTSAAYASNHDGLIRETQAALWIHGHVHAPCDYHVGRTRVLCNPRGYPDEPVIGFTDRLIAEVRRECATD